MWKFKVNFNLGFAAVVVVVTTYLIIHPNNDLGETQNIKNSPVVPYNYSPRQFTHKQPNTTDTHTYHIHSTYHPLFMH